MKPYFAEQLSLEEARMWRTLTNGLPEYFYDQAAKQEALLDYIRARIELANLEHMERLLMMIWKSSPLDSEVRKDYQAAANMLKGKRQEVNQHRSNIGLSTRFESQLHTKTKLGADDEDEPPPWEPKDE